MTLSGRIGLAAALFATSALGLILEIVAARLIAPYVGMSIYTWTAIIATVLAGMSAGHWIGGRLAERPDRQGLGIIALMLALATLNVLVIPVLLRWAAPALLQGDGGVVVAVSMLSGVLFFVPSLLIAGVTPILTRIAIDAEPGRRGIVIGRMFALGAGGAILGTLAAGFVFISWIGSQGTLLSIAAALGLMAAGFALWTRQARTAQVSALLVILAAAFAAFRADALLASACDVESRYYCIRIVDFSAETDRESRLMVLDHMGHGINDRHDPTRLHSSYVELTDRMVALRFPGTLKLSSYFIGGGAYTLPRAWAATYPLGTHVVAEVDPMVTKLARERMWFEPSPAVRIGHVDGRVLLRAAKDASLDVVIGDAFHDISVPQHLVTLEFAQEIRAKLRPDGAYVMTVIDAAREPKFMLSMLKTLREVFPAVEIWVDDEQMGGGGRLTYLLSASDVPAPVSTLTSRQNPGRRWHRVNPGAVAGSLSPDDLPVLTDDLAPVDRLIGVVAEQAR
ncbi:MAG: fused MFS/spermidine synthase [Rhodospirillales bacterium]|nr:fused MFS/spermidine synthase [Rhodospirillales bacterium]MBO6787959.1 fused MFS/spermidine synthase [Rhodospirillales bacterium]